MDVFKTRPGVLAVGIGFEKLVVGVGMAFVSRVPPLGDAFVSVAVVDGHTSAFVVLGSLVVASLLDTVVVVVGKGVVVVMVAVIRTVRAETASPAPRLETFRVPTHNPSCLRR